MCHIKSFDLKVQLENCLWRLLKRFGLSAFDWFFCSYVHIKLFFFHLQGKTKDYDMLIQKLADPDIKVYFVQLTLITGNQCEECEEYD